MLPTEMLAKLDAMDDYDRQLAYDRFGRDHRMSAAEVEAQYNAWKSGASMPSSSGAAPSPQAQVPGGTSASYIQDAHKYRPAYDPSQEGRSRQSKIEQAVICPACGSALGIPASRPIKVTCPGCLTESTFTA
jgi:hypothetical protein